MDGGERWIFGYGSLLWRPAFEFVERAPACLDGFARRLWQGSPDHRGSSGAPGRVATLVRERGARCWGAAYRVREEAWPDVMRGLDVRESGGFERLAVKLRFAEAGRGTTEGIVYVAGEGNPNFLGPAPALEIAAQVRCSRGRSGSNAEYVLRLAEALRALGVEDSHVAGIASLLVSRIADAH